MAIGMTVQAVLAQGPASNDYLVTAGHCDEGPGTHQWQHRQIPFGDMVVVQDGGHSDVGGIKVDNGWNASPTYYETVSVRSLQRPLDDFVGQGVCKSGVNSGYTCGAILGRNFSPPGRKDFRRTSACDLAGDSGAPVVLNNLFSRAAGIVSGGYGPVPYTGVRDDYEMYYSHAGFIAGELNVEIKFAP